MFMQNRIAVAIEKCNSNNQFTSCYPEYSIGDMDKGELRVQKLRSLVTEDGGPAKFAQRSIDAADKPIDPTYVSQILNGHRSFGEKAAENMARRAGLPYDYFDSHEASSEDAKQPVFYQTRHELIETLIANLAAQSTDDLRVALLEIELGVVRAKQSQHTVYPERPERRSETIQVDRERRGSPTLRRPMMGEGLDPDSPLIVNRAKKTET